MSNQIPFQTKSGKIVYVEVEYTRVLEATSGAHTVLAPGSAASTGPAHGAR